MPTYEYECSACEYAFEKYQSMTDPKLKKCPECGRLKLQRLIGAGAGIIFKGSGFYETDYKPKVSTDTEAKNSKPAEPKAEKSASTETKASKSTTEIKTKVAAKDT